MADIVLFHSILGLRPVELELADEWRAAGHEVATPDLYGGRTADDYDGGFALLQEIGLDEVAARALAAVEPLPPRTVLAGVSMGGGMAARAWARRPETAGVLFLCGPGPWPDHARSTPVQMHVARPDPFDEESVFVEWAAENPGMPLETFRYDGVGHYFLDASLDDFDADADALCRQRCAAFLKAL